MIHLSLLLNNWREKSPAPFPLPNPCSLSSCNAKVRARYQLSTYFQAEKWSSCSHLFYQNATHCVCQYSLGFMGTPVAWRPLQMMGWESDHCPCIPSELELLFRFGSDYFPAIRQYLSHREPKGRSSSKAALHFRQLCFFLLQVLTPCQLLLPSMRKWKQSCWNQTVLLSSIKLSR